MGPAAAAPGPVAAVSGVSDQVAVAAPADSPAPLRRLARAGALSLGTSVAIQGLSVVSGVLLARVLGPSGRGELAAVLLWPGVLTAVGGLSAVEGITYWTARRAAPMRTITATAFLISQGLALALVAVGYLLVPVVLGRYGAEAVFAGRLYLAWIPIYLACQAALGILQGTQRWAALNSWRLAGIAATVAGLAGLAAAHRLTVTNATWVYVAANAAALLLAIATIAVRRWLGLRPGAGLARAILAFGLKTHLGNLAGQANLNLDKVAIALFLAPSALGLYSAAVTLSAPLTLVGSSIAIVAMPVVAASASPVERRRQFGWFVRSALCLSAATALVLVVLAPVLIRVFFGAAFLPAVLVAQVSITAGLARAMIWVLGHGLFAFDKPLVPSVAEVIAVAVTLAGLAVLLPAMGLLGAAITSLLAYSGSAAYMVWFANRRLDMGLADMVLPRAADAGAWARCLR